MRILMNGQLHHLETVVGLDDPFRRFMGRESGGNEDHFIKMEGLSNLFRSPEVTQMNGIERPTE